MNTSLILDAIILPFVWLIAFIFITGLGFVVAPFKKQQGVLYANIFTWFWYGLAILIGLLQLWNLFVPVNLYTWLCFLPFALFGIDKLLKSHVIIRYPVRNIASVLLVLVFVFLILSSLDNSFIYDSRVYHFPYINWLNLYRIAPGMANVYIYLGVNQSYFLFPAFLNSLWTNYRGACATNGLLAMVICSEIILSNLKVFAREEKFTFKSAYQLLFLPLCINIGVQNLSSPTPDVFVNLFTFKIISDLITCLDAKKLVFQDIFLLAFYCLFGLVMKLSFIGVSAGLAIPILYLFIKNKIWDAKNFIYALMFFIFLFVPLIIRGVVATGYLLFPLPKYSFAVDWRVPLPYVENFHDFVIGFARTLLHGPEGIAAAHNYTWIPAWSKRMATSIQVVIPIVLFLGAIIFTRLKKINTFKLRLVLIAIAIAIVFWIVTAPDVRFAVFTLWSLGLAPLAYLISVTDIKWVKCFPIVIIVCAVLIMIKNWNTDLQPIGDIQKQETITFTSNYGLKVNVVKTKPNSDMYELTGCPMPCSVVPDSNLMMRGKKIEDGFRIIVKQIHK